MSTAIQRFYAGRRMTSSNCPPAVADSPVVEMGAGVRAVLPFLLVLTPNHDSLSHPATAIHRHGERIQQYPGLLASEWQHRWNPRSRNDRPDGALHSSSCRSES